MDSLELKIIEAQEKVSKDISKRNEKIGNIFKAIDKINLELDFFALEPTFIIGFENKNFDYCCDLFLEDDRFVVYLSNKGKLSMSYNKEYVKLFPDDWLDEILQKLNDFIFKFENGTSELDYCLC